MSGSWELTRLWSSFQAPPVYSSGRIHFSPSKSVLDVPSTASVILIGLSTLGAPPAAAAAIGGSLATIIESRDHSSQLLPSTMAVENVSPLVWLGGRKMTAA